jgi:hypothetical protein
MALEFIPHVTHALGISGIQSRVQSSMLFPILAAAMVLGRQKDTWLLLPNFDPKGPKQVWSVLVDAESEGVNHHATFELKRVTKSVSPSKTIDTFSWDNLTVDDKEGQDIPDWDASVDKNGAILQMQGETEDSYRRMLAPLIFIYPDHPVSEGEKWKIEVKPKGTAGKLTYAYEAEKRELVEGTNTLVIAVKLTEEGKQPISGTGYWWLSRVGKVVKFDMKLENWIVPMAGSEVTNVIVRGIVK